MARWQLQCSGKDEELHCKFCNQDLPNWRKTLFRDVMDDDAETEAEEEAVKAKEEEPAPDSVNAAPRRWIVSDRRGVRGSAARDRRPACRSTTTP